MTAGLAWYSASRAAFLDESPEEVIGRLASAAGRDGWHIEPEQHQEWYASVNLLQRQLAREVEILRSALSNPALSDFTTVVLEYDLRRRGLRIDCVLLGRGVIAVLEFKRSGLAKADVDQVENYCVNLLEFHRETRRLCQEDLFVLVPVLVLTEAGSKRPGRPSSTLRFMAAPWDSIAQPTRVGSQGDLAEVLFHALQQRRVQKDVDADRWLDAPFSPSSTILDAALSLYGQHDVSAIEHHAAPVESIERCTNSVVQWIRKSRQDRRNRVIFVSGAPGSGKTLLGLQIAFHPEFQEDAVFVTGNAPLVDVLEAALKASYKRGAKAKGLTGYPRSAAARVIENSTFKIVKAHAFLGERGANTGSSDGRIVIFDEAQRTYEKGRRVLRKELEDDEAVLILRAMERSYESGCVVVALLGHNQFINSGEVGSGAWIHAAQRRRWQCVISSETRALMSDADRSVLEIMDDTAELEIGHLQQSMRYYRNEHVERWASTVLEGSAAHAQQIAGDFADSDEVWLTRSLEAAKNWVRRRRIGQDRVGMIGSSNAGRLAAEGLFVNLKPSIADWMLLPDGDIRSSNMLETIQNQYQVQGLEIDYSLVCWDLDLRRENAAWGAYKLGGTRWNRQRDLEVAKNQYRVLLTRARKGMVIFVPRGDSDGVDETRPPEMYDEIAEYLVKCGAQPIPEESDGGIGAKAESIRPA